MQGKRDPDYSAMKERAEIYTPAFYESEKETSRISAEVVVPLVMSWAAPTSVIDLGCGPGDWLAVFQGAGVQEIRGIDGDWVQQDQLAIPAHAFRVHDLTRPYVADRCYDLAMSLEVTQGMPPPAGQSLVNSLTDLAPVVLFSSAIPHQGGENHINCQWPAYWADLFLRCGYVVIDALRPRIWGDSRVAWWYRQNMMLYVHTEQLKRWPELEAMRHYLPDKPLSLIHPERFQAVIDWAVEGHKKYWHLYLEQRSTLAAKEAEG
jgi:hypothetical protein